MKRNIHLLSDTIRKFRLPAKAMMLVIVLLLSASLVNAASISSTATGGNWSSIATWTGGVVPGSSDDVTIIGGATVTLDGNRTCNGLIVNLTGVFNVNAQLTLQSKKDITVNGAINFNSTGIIFGNGSGANAQNFTLTSGASLSTANISGITTNGSTGSVKVSGTITFTAGANYTYNGTAVQVTGTGLTGANNLTINNSSGVTLSAATVVAGTLTLTSGILTTTGTNLLSITNTATSAISGGSATSFINGPVQWTLPPSLGSGSTYTLPVGKGGVYLPLALVNPTTGTGVVTAQVQAFAANPGGTFDATLTSVSTSEYWSLVTVGNFTNSSLTLSRPTAITPLDVIGGSTTAAGLYTSLDGTTGANGVSGSNAIGANRFFAFAAKKLTITTITINGSPFCAGASVNVPFTYNPKINFAGATFTAQLSDVLGTFGVPVVLQSVASDASGSQSINVTIPGGTVAGTLYRIRLVSTTPSITGTDNGANITVSSATPVQSSIITGNAAPCANAAGITYSVTPVAGVTYIWSFPGDWTQTAGGTTNSVTVTTGSTSGNVVVTPSNACGSGTARILAVALIAGPVITVQPSTTPQSLCQNGSVSGFSVTATGGTSYQWYSNTSNSNSGGTSLGATNGAQTNSYTPLTTSTGTFYYYCVVTGTCSPVATSDVSGPVSINVPPALSITPASRCGTGTVTLTATPSSCLSSTVSWWDAATNGNMATGVTPPGTSFTTPSISTTTTYYAQENFTGGLTSLGATSLVTNNYGLVFDLSEQIVLNSVQVNAISGGNVTIQLQNNAGTTISTSASTAVSTGTNTIALNWTIPAGSGYRLLKNAGVNLGTTNPFTTWPVGFDVGSITSSYEGGVVTSKYDYFYNWSISRDRVAAIATIGSPIISGFAGSRCGAGTVVLGAVASAGNINWYDASTGGTQVANNTSTYTTPSLSTTTTYYVDATDGACISSPRIAVVASIITPPSITATGAGTYCYGTDVNLTSTSAVTNRYWIGPNNFYSLSNNPALTAVTTAMSGTYTVKGSALSGVNIVANGDFESGNVGFESSYIYAAPVTNALWNEGLYTIWNNPHDVHNNWVNIANSAHSGTKQMIVNGATVANVNIWSQTVNVVPNTAYQYTYWVQNVLGGVGSSPSKLQLYINGSPAGPIYIADINANVWLQFTYNWNSGSATTAYLSLVNQNVDPGGNDFALDDIVFQPACESTASVVVTVSADVTAGTIGSNQAICSGLTPATLTSTTAGTGSGTVSYEWQTNASGSYVTIGGATSATYSPPALTSTTSYQRRTVSLNNGTTCTSPYTAPVTITVNAATTATAGGPNTVCQSATPTPITLTGASIGGSATTGAWSIVSEGGGSLSNYSQTATPATVTYTPALNYSGTVTLRLTTNNVGCTAIADRTITVRPTPTASISGTTTVCQNATAPDITFTNPQTLPVTITYNINSGTNTTVNVSASTTSTIAAPTVTAGTYAYNLVSVVYQTAPTCSNAITGTAIVTVDPTSVGGSVTGGTTICSGSTSGLLSLSGQTGTVTKWQYSVSPFSTWTDIANTATTYTSGALTQTTQFRAVVTSGVCSLANSVATTVTVVATPATPGAITGTTPQCAGVTGQTYSISAVTYATTYTWVVPAGWSITAGAGTASITVTAGSAGQNGNITVTAGNSCGTSAASTLAVTVNGITWLGSINTEWNNAGNWCGGIPTATSNVTIPSSLSYYPVISGASPANDVTISGTGKLQIQDGATLTLDSVPLLTFQSGATITTGTGSKIILKSGSRYLNLSSNTPTLEMQRQLTGTKGWRMVASPVATKYSDMFKSPLVTQGFTNSTDSTLQPNLMWWDETDAGTTLQGWRKPANLTDAISAGRGYFHFIFDGAGIRNKLDTTFTGFYYSDVLPQTMSVTGVENFNGSDKYNYTLTYTARAISQTPIVSDSTYYDLNALDQGWNLIGNPTASTLDWKSMTKTNVDNSFYVWDPSALSGNGDYLTWNGISGTLGNGRIPPFQAFWVHADSASPPPTISFTNVAKTDTAGVFMRSPAVSENKAVIIPLTLSGHQMQTTSFISFDNNGIIGPDKWDAYRLESMSDTWIELYTLSSPHNVSPLVINNLPLQDTSLVNIPLFVGGQIKGTGISDRYTLQWQIPANWPSDWNISLQDHQASKAISMTDNTYYTFTYTSLAVKPATNSIMYSPKQLVKHFSKTSQTTSNTPPFTIIISKGGKPVEYMEPKPHFLPDYANPFSNSTILRFSLPESAQVFMNVYNLSGICIETLTNAVYPAGFTEIEWQPRNSIPGMYFIRFISGDTVETRKVILKN